MKSFYLFLIVIEVCFNVSAKAVDSYMFKHLSIEDGLSSNFVKCIYKDSFGYLWFGTLEGINRYDGDEVRNFNHYFPDDAKSVTSIYEDDDNILWIGTEKGLFYWDRIAIHFTEVKNGIVGSNSIGKICGFSDHHLLFFCANSFFLLETHSFELQKLSFHKEASRYLDQVTDFFLDGDQLYISTKGGFIQYDLVNRSSLLYDKSHFGKTSEISFSCITKYENRIYFGTSSDGIMCFNLDTREFSSIGEFDGSIILSLACFGNNLFVGTDSNGLLLYHINTGQTKKIVHIDNDPLSISSNAIYSLLIDDSETLWAGTYAGGVSYSSLKSNMFQIYNFQSDYSLSNKSIRSVCFYDSTRFIGTRNGLYVISEEKDMQYFSVDNSPLKAKIILSLFEYKGSVFIGTYGGGLYKYSFETKNIQEWNPDYFNNLIVYAFKQDHYGNMWIATLSGLYETDGQNVTMYNTRNSEMKSDLIYALNIDSLGRLWMGTDNNIAVFDIKDNEFSLISDFSLFPSFKTNSFYCDSNSRMWVASEKHGVYCINDDLTLEFIIETEDGLCNNSVSSIVESNIGEYWISTLKGLTHLFLEQKLFFNYSFSSGLPGLVFNPNAGVKDETGTIWFGNEKGLVYFDPKTIIEKATERNLVITDIYIGGKPINEKYDILNIPVEEVTVLKLRGKNSNIGFRFVDLLVPHTIESTYAAKLQRRNTREEEWVNLDYQDKVFYNSLKPGVYDFHIGIIDRADVVLPNSIKTIQIRIVSEWYQSFKVLIIIALIILFFGFIIFIRRPHLPALNHPKGEFNNSSKGKYKFSRLDKEHSRQLFAEIQDYIKTSQSYLNPDLKISDVAKEINHSSQEVSQAINQNLGHGFTDFINYYRVNEVKDELKRPDSKLLTLPAIANKSGFNSKSSFYRAFKKVTGQTPADYWSDLQKKS